MLCILYVTAVGALLGVVGVIIERVLPATWPRRWIWSLIIPLSIALPGYYRFHHNWSVVGALGHSNSAMQSMGVGSIGLMDPMWWFRIDAYGPMIEKVWLIASEILVIWGIVNAARISWIILRSRINRKDSSGGPVVDGVRVIVTDSVGPATIGLLRSRVIVPRWVLALPGVQRRYILRHEEEHQRSHDVHLLFVASLAILLMPWNLAMWWQLKRFCLAIEIDCDNRVVRSLGNPHEYGELLLKVAQLPTGGPRLRPAFLGAGMLERRLTALVAPTRLRKVHQLLLPAAAIALLAIVLWMPHPVVGSHTHGSTPATTTSAR